VQGQTVAGIITISGTAADDDCVQSVEVKIGGDGEWKTANGGYNGQYVWSILWDTTSVENAPKTIYARSKDNDGAHSEEDLVSVNVDNSDPDFFFIHITDLHLSITTYAENVWGSFVKLVKNMNPQPAFIVCTGDIADTGACTAGELTYRLFTLYGLDKTDSGWNLEGTNIPIYFCPGNHDAYSLPDVSLNFDNYRNFIGPFYYNQNFPVAGHTVSIFSLTGGVDTELLNGMSNGDGLDDKYGEEVTNFQSDLANSNADIKIVLCHQGYVIPYDTGYFENYNRHITGDPNDFGKWCTDHGVDVVCTGHIHAGSIMQKDDTYWPVISPLSNTYWKTNTDDTMYVITAEIGANIIDPGDGGRHYRVINVYSDGSIKTQDGQQYTSFSESKITNNLLVNKQISQSFSNQLLQNMFEKTLYNQQQNQQYGQSSQQLSQMMLKQSQSSR
jgi:DNA repair exonuclease SbcCD nuclease subunit